MKKQLIIAFACIATIFYACEEEQIFGDALIYMPQATHNIGTDNNLTVDLTASSSPDTSIVLGVYRSGLQDLQEFTVDMVINTDTIPKAKAEALKPGANAKYNIYKTGELLPSNYYEALDGKITVPSGSRDVTTHLILKKSSILANYSSGSILLLPVQIKNPTMYELNESLCLTMVVVRVK